MCESVLLLTVFKIVNAIINDKVPQNLDKIV